MQWEFIVVLVLAIPIILFPAAFVWYLNVSGMYAAIQEARRRRAARKHYERETGAPAIIGRRIKSSVLAIVRPMPIILPIAMLIGIYASLMWFFLASLGWGIAVVLALTIPIILILGTFVWYLNVSGVYQVIRDTQRKRARDRRLVQMLRRAMVQMLEEAMAEERPVATEAKERLKV